MGFFDRFFGPPSRDKFAKLFMAALREAGDQRTARYDADQFLLVYDDEGGFTNLRNFYNDYCAVDRSERKSLLKMQVRGSLSHLKEMPEDFEDAKCDLYPKLWARSSLENLRLQQRRDGGDGMNIPTQVIGDHFECSLAFDLPEAVRTIGQDDLDAWGVTFYEAMEFARQNLESTEFAFASIGDSMYGSLTGDSYDATRLTYLDLIRKLKVKGEHIAMVPNRDSLLVTGSDDEAGLAMMQAYAEKAIEEQSRPMAEVPMRLDGDDWVGWMPDQDHPLYATFRAMELRFLHPLYEEQKELLDAIHENEGVDVFVASYTGMEKDTGELVSYCVWSNGIESLLPKAQKVALIRGKDDIPALGSWDRVVDVVGYLMKETDDYPHRYYVSEFPSDAELAAIGSEEL